MNLRAYVPLGMLGVSLAMRAVGDWMFGNVPFYERARFDDTFALGGSLGVRGVPAGGGLRLQSGSAFVIRLDVAGITGCDAG